MKKKSLLTLAVIGGLGWYLYRQQQMVAARIAAAQAAQAAKAGA